MKKFLLFTLFFRLAFISNAQDIVIESSNQADDFKNHGQYKSGLQEHDTALEMKPTSANALIHQANLKRLLNDPQGALVDLNKAHRLNPKDPTVYYTKAITEHGIGMYAQAIKDFDKALTLGEDADYYLGRANAKKALNQYPEAFLDYAKALEIRPEFSDAYYYRGNAKFKSQSHRNKSE